MSVQYATLVFLKCLSWCRPADLFELETHGSKIGKHRFNVWPTVVERLGTDSPLVPRLERIGSNVWEPAVPLLPQLIRP